MLQMHQHMEIKSGHGAKWQRFGWETRI